jgi:hypothetical protein
MAEAQAEQKHTPEPWVKDYRGTIGHIKSIAPRTDRATPTLCRYDLTAPGINETEQHANAERIVQCVNAMSGIDDPEAAMAKVRKALDEARGHVMDPDTQALMDEALALLGEQPTD